MSALDSVLKGMGESFTSAISSLKDDAVSATKGFLKSTMNDGNLMGILKDPSKGGFLGRAAAFGGAGAAVGAGTHLATGALGIPTSALGLTENDMSIGGTIGAAFRGGVVGAGLGVGGFRADGQMRSGLKNIFGSVGAGASDKQFASMTKSLGEEAQEGLFGQISRAMTEGRTSAINQAGVKRFGQEFADSVASRQSATQAQSLGASLEASSGAFSDLSAKAGGLSYGESFMNRAVGAAKEFKSGGAAATVGAATAAGGFVNTLYGSNALGVSIPSNYGYR